MLKRFEVTNFKGFKDKLVFDLTAREYGFNKSIISNGIVNKAIIYGKNGIGKSNLGIALFDIITHLTDKEIYVFKKIMPYLNLDSNSEYATFTYYFQFGNDEVIYTYRKSDPFYLVDEKLTINKKELIYYNYLDAKNNKIDKALVNNLNIELTGRRLSVIKYIYRNSPQTPNSPLDKFMKFVDKMLWYKGSLDGFDYCGFINGNREIEDELYENDKKDDLQYFLKSNGMEYKLEWEILNGKHELMAVFPTGKKAVFSTIASTGTIWLYLYFYWLSTSFNDISFLFIDEFDAFFHYESAEQIVCQLNGYSRFQSILTSHNIYLMQNKLTRPDCCYLMTKNKIANLFDSTDKEIREVHNLEKMYINGAFNK